MYIFCFNQIPHPLFLTISLSHCSPIIQQLTVHCIMLYSRINEFQHFSFSTILFPSPVSCSPLRQLLPPVVPSDSSCLL
jgi:hypothetical protein